MILSPIPPYCGRSRSRESKADMNGKAEAENENGFLFSCETVVSEYCLFFSCSQVTLEGSWS